METIDEVFLGFKGQNEISFLKRFSTENSCKEHLYKLKWSSGFHCPHCGSQTEHQCSKMYHKRCSKCLRVFSVTNNTLFHNVKFGLVKAFYIVFKMSATTKSVSAEQMAKKVGINRKSALLFQQKVRLAMQSSQKHPMCGEVEVDEAFIGGKEEGKIGRGAEKKTQIVVAIEKYGKKGLKRMYARTIKNASTQEIKTIFEKHISKVANVLTDNWKSYMQLSNEYNIRQEKSKPDQNFQVMHRSIQQLKSWIRGIHHSVDPLYLQGYLDEFCYRINRSKSKDGIFDNLMVRMINAKPVIKNNIKFCYSC